VQEAIRRIEEAIKPAGDVTAADAAGA